MGTLNWVTPPPQVVVIGHLYRVGCRLDLNKTVAREYKSLKLDDITIWSVISKFPDEADRTEWEFSDKILPEIGVHRSIATNSNVEENLHSISKLFEYRPSREDSHKSFKCIAKVDETLVTTNYNLKQQIKVSESFQVEYPPFGLDAFHEAQETGSHVISEAVKWNDIDITIEFEANPLPSKEQMRWHIVRDTSDLSIILLPEQASHRMLASAPIISNTVNNDSLSSSKVVAQLKIKDVRPEDGNDFFYLEVRNRHGSSEFRFALNVVDFATKDYADSSYDALTSSSSFTNKLLWPTMSLTLSILICF